MNARHTGQADSAPPGRLWRITAWLAAAAALGGVFLLYGQPDLMVTLSQQLWACFGH